MTLTDSMKAHYETVLSDLTTRRSDHHREVAVHQKAIREVDPMIAAIARILGIQAAPPRTTPPRPQTSDSNDHRYVNVGTRWAILDILDRADDPLSISGIADALLTGGMRTNATNFKNNVSAVLSNMKSQRHEADVSDGVWKITETGQSVIAHIRTSHKSPWPRPRSSAKIDGPGMTTPGPTSRKEVSTVEPS